MASPPVSILKKPSFPTAMPRDDVASVNAKTGNGTPASVDNLSAGVKRSADAAFGKDQMLLAPNKVAARTPKAIPPSSEPESSSVMNKVSESDSQKAQTSVVKRPEPNKKAVQSKPVTTKIDDRKTEHGLTTSVRKTSEDVSKSGSVFKIQNKASLHSTSVTSSAASTVTTTSKTHTHRDAKPTDSSRHPPGLKESSVFSSDSADKHSLSHGSTTTSSSSSKPKTSHATPKELTTKERSADDRDKPPISDDRDSTSKTTPHAKHHQPEHRHSGKPDDSGKTSKASLPTSASKPVSRDPGKPDKSLHCRPKPETANSGKKDGLESAKKDSAGHSKPISSSKSERDHKDDSNRDKTSLSDMQAKPPKKPVTDSFSRKKPSVPLKPSSASSSSKPKHTEKSSVGDRKNEANKREPSHSADKAKKLQSSAVDKKKSVKKKPEKRPEEKREVRRRLMPGHGFSYKL